MKPYLIKAKDGVCTPLDPLPHKKGVSKQEEQHDEKWLQDLLFKHPEILPIEHINEDYAPLISIGREIEKIDNLFISPKGFITIVETKLWRNPEAYRDVVAQILGYAITLNKWKYNELDTAVNRSMAKYSEQSMAATSMYDIVKGKTRGFETEKPAFEDSVQGCLRHGKFALLIVGDKIHPTATDLAEVIGSTPALQYTLSFVEIRCYRLNHESSSSLVVIPEFVKTIRDDVRAVVRIIQQPEKAEPEVVVTDVDETADEKRARSTSLKVFIASLPSYCAGIFESYLQHWQTVGYTIFRGTVGFSLRIPWNGGFVTVFEAHPWDIGVCRDKVQVKHKLPPENHKQYKSDLEASPVLNKAFVKDGRKFIRFEEMRFEDVRILLEATDKLAEGWYEASKEVVPAQPG
jgi:hypothetical protein